MAEKARGRHAEAAEHRRALRAGAAQDYRHHDAHFRGELRHRVWCDPTAPQIIGAQRIGTPAEAGHVAVRAIAKESGATAMAAAKAAKNRSPSPSAKCVKRPATPAIKRSRA